MKRKRKIKPLEINFVIEELDIAGLYKNGIAKVKAFRELEYEMHKIGLTFENILNERKISDDTKDYWGLRELSKKIGKKFGVSYYTIYGWTTLSKHKLSQLSFPKEIQSIELLKSLELFTSKSSIKEGAVFSSYNIPYDHKNSNMYWSIVTGCLLNATGELAKTNEGNASHQANVNGFEEFIEKINESPITFNSKYHTNKNNTRIYFPSSLSHLYYFWDFMETKIRGKHARTLYPTPVLDIPSLERIALDTQISHLTSFASGGTNSEFPVLQISRYSKRMRESLKNEISNHYNIEPSTEKPGLYNYNTSRLFEIMSQISPHLPHRTKWFEIGERIGVF